MRKGKFVCVIFIFFVILFFSIFSLRSYAAAPVLRLVAGAAAEQVVQNTFYAIGERVGVHFENETAQQKAFKRWNYTLDDLYRYVEENGDYVWKQRIEDFEKEIKNVKVEEIPSRPGFGRVVLSIGAFLTGADLIYEAYNSFIDGYGNTQKVKGLDYTELAKVTYASGTNSIYVGFSSDNSPYLRIEYFDKNGQINYRTKFSTYSVSNPGSIWYRYEKMDSDFVYVTLVYFGTMNGKTGFHESSSMWTVDRKYYDVRVRKDNVGEVGMDITSSDIPTVNVPSVLPSYIPNRTRPTVLPMPTQEEIPELKNLPKEIELIIPIDRPWNPELSLNEPISENMPEPEPIQKPEPTPGNDPIPDDESEPGEQLEPGEEPVPEPSPSPGDSCGEYSFRNWKVFSVLTEKFPFSIPWDVKRAFHAAFGDLHSGDGKFSFKLGSSIKGIQGTTISVKIPEYFDSWITMFRSVFLILFDVGLIYAIYRWFGGSS